MSMQDDMHSLEAYYFGKYVNEDLIEKPYIDSSTWRGFSSKFKTKDYASHVLLYAYEHITLDLEAFLDKHEAFTREEFDVQHHQQVENLRVYLNIQPNNDSVAPAANGEYYGRAYNSYAKVVDLANKHWFCKVFLSTKKNTKYANRLVAVRNALHVPIDIQVLNGIRDLLARNEQPPIDLPKGGMGTVKTFEKYRDLQQAFRNLVDPVPSDRFPGETVAPLVIDSYWPKSQG